MASVYSAFPCIARECANLLSGDHLFLHFCWNILFMLFCMFSCQMYRCPFPVVCACIISICFPFQSIKCYSSVASERMVMALQNAWIWQGSMCCQHFLASQHRSTTSHHMCRQLRIESYLILFKIKNLSIFIILTRSK